ncbi:TPA: PrgH/EprH family type III secretion apparatus protein [Salmonella enterica]|nr:hypothetical protein [Salmonella enterica subsp. diarizonae]HEA0263519.1 PrgH/EprH family type III secretion apparatus protein [Salmonella enterica]HEA0268614.1 PrgH/EprH family type III secretion apparatus protein [Salmonella enterica]HEA0295551.1 PrgH/EprH family type III secretion apparatus protein [Salmonella enterica]HEA0304660.1 PrgH/EprH family type III secretion apparatus protein [Salmonella enterica]
MENTKMAVLTIRLLNSPFAGCEYPIFKGRTLFIIGGDAIFNEQTGIYDLPSDTILIPFDNGGVNLEILCNDAGKITFREIRAEKTTERNIEQNHPVEIGKLKIAFLSAESKWAPCILQYSELDEQISYHNRKLFRNIFFALSGALLLVLSAYTYFLVTLRSESEKVVKSLNVLLENNTKRFNILNGQDGIIYVLSRDEREAVWAKQALEKTGRTHTVRVTNYALENQKFDKWMKDNFPGLLYYRLQMDNPRIPQLWMSQKAVTLNEEQLGRLKKKCQRFFPIYGEWIFLV